MSGNPSVKIDWFDGTLVECSTSKIEPGPSLAQQSENINNSTKNNSHCTERKIMGFMKLQELSNLDHNSLVLQLSGRTSFWDLLNTELKDDLIVLVVKILAKLYQYLELNPTSPALDYVLKTKFLKSEFFNSTLGKYLARVPDTKMADKRFNMQFWNDLESFYNNVVTIGSGFYSKNHAMWPEALGLISLSLFSVENIRNKQSLCFDREFINSLVIHRIDEHNLKTTNPGNFTIKNLNIFPTKDDILGEEPEKLQPNIIDGAYVSMDHYLEIQFKLLREDCFGPLRKGLAKYRENPNSRLENIRVHKRVRVISRTHVTKMSVGHLVDIAWQQRLHKGSVNCAKEKQLMNGSLVLLTSDNFQTVLFATVIDSFTELLSKGYVAIQFHTPISKTNYNEQFLMIESEVFFEPYHRVLKVLQGFSCDIPMKSYIVDVQKETKPPRYANAKTLYSLMYRNREIQYPLLNTNLWPPEDYFGLDQAQMEAYKLALTREFAVIQGPPGTGKTYIGIKVATTLLKNLSLTDSPMLIVCYTNHALDQFLEGIVKVTSNVVRLGSQSKHPDMDSYTLWSWKQRCKSKYSYLFNEPRAKLEKIFQKISNIQVEVNKCDNEILCYSEIRNYLEIDTKLYIKRGLEDPILTWLFYHLHDNLENDSWKGQSVSDARSDSEDVDTCFSSNWAEQEIESLNKNIKYVQDAIEDEETRDNMIGQLAEKIRAIRMYLKEFKKSDKFKGHEVPKHKVEDAYKDYTPEEKWQIYYNAANKVKIQLLEPVLQLQEQADIYKQELEDIECLVDAEVIKNARVIGATTTMAARRHKLLCTLKSSIVIVEEAAEVLEAHIVASLTHQCQHVILIGDHKQLKPSTAYYQLAKAFNLDISLFERMIRNGIHSRTLTTQRRMRPEFVELLVPIIYDRLDCHSSVSEYPPVRGIEKNLYFYTHEHLEDQRAQDDSSRKNTLEAKLCVSLANWFRQKRYDANEITILATYSKQCEVMKTIAAEYVLLTDVLITTVDNYQGEENRIVILSLVRSNRDRNIGFLATENRVCVALSRAKEGFYMFGNMNCLKAASPLWRAINEKLMKLDSIGSKLPLINDEPEVEIENKTRRRKVKQASIAEQLVPYDRPCICL